MIELDDEFACHYLLVGDHLIALQHWGRRNNQCRRCDDDALRERLKALAEERRRFGYRRR